MAQVRAAVRQDAGSIAEVHVASWRAAYHGVFSDLFLDSLSVDDRARRWRQVLIDGREHVAVIEEDGQIVGFAVVGASRDDDAADAQVGELQAIYLHPHWWEHGFGAGLIDAATAWLVDAGFLAATLWVLDRNDHARRFYEHHGWRPDGSVKLATIGGVEITEVRYRRMFRKNQ
jgi:GNAT superfamily N-acetyltransferase